MAKTPNQAVGVDFGRSAIKSVLLSRRGGNRFVLNGYAIRAVDSPAETPEQITQQLQLLFRQMGGGCNHCAVAVTHADAILRIIEQPETPTEILREALRLNGMALLNQEVKELVLDCDLINPAAKGGGAGDRLKYLVGGLPRTVVTNMSEGFQKVRKNSLKGILLPPVCAFNAFEFSNPDVFENEAFMLVDIGHLSSTLTVGVKREMILVRSIEFCGKLLLHALTSHAGVTQAEAITALETGGNQHVVETARLMLTALTREISSSIGFFEGRREETISRIFVSGGPAKSKAIMEIISEDLHMPCKLWDPFKSCEIGLGAAQKQSLSGDIVNLGIACGAAVELLKGKQ